MLILKYKKGLNYVKKTRTLTYSAKHSSFLRTIKKDSLHIKTTDPFRVKIFLDLRFRKLRKTRINLCLKIFTLCSRWTDSNKEQWIQKDLKRKILSFSETQLLKKKTFKIKIMNFNNWIRKKSKKMVDVSVLAKMVNLKMLKRLIHLI
jgi:hypothetical protein